ncbi:MAG: CRISPR-associated endonuclease Cas2 [Bacillota bacterium]
MMVLIAYDVNTETPEGRARLRRIAKQCVNFGQRVQNSVFECKLDPPQLADLKNKLNKIIDPEKDSLRYYNLGKNWNRKVEHIGAKPTYDPDAPMVL